MVKDLRRCRALQLSPSYLKLSKLLRDQISASVRLATTGMFLPETSKQAEQEEAVWGTGGGLFRCRQRCQNSLGWRRRVIVVSLLALCVGSLLLLESGSVGHLAESPISNPGRVLLVTAHPDDEVIFFSSTITALHASGSQVFLLCLTNGTSYAPCTETVQSLYAGYVVLLKQIHQQVVASAGCMMGVALFCWARHARIDDGSRSRLAYKFTNVVSYTL